MKSKKIRIALPAGSLKEPTIELMRKAGFRIHVAERSYTPTVDDDEIECMLIRAQEIPRYVEQGKFDVGITGKDWIEESERSVEELAELKYSKRGSNAVKIIIAVPESSPVKCLTDLEGKTIATEFVKITKKFLKKNRINAKPEFSWGATESKPPYLADAIVELTDSGESLKANNLRIVATILESTTRIIANSHQASESYFGGFRLLCCVKIGYCHHEPLHFLFNLSTVSNFERGQRAEKICLAS